MDQQPRLAKRKLVFLLLFTCSFVVSVSGRFLFLLVLGMGCAFLLWHSLVLPLIIMDGQNLTNFCIHTINDKIKVGFANRHFSQIELRPLINVKIGFCSISWEWNTKFKQFLYTHYHWQNFCWHCKLSTFANLQRSCKPWFTKILYTHYLWQNPCLYCESIIFRNLQQSYGPWLMPEIVFCSIFW